MPYENDILKSRSGEIDLYLAYIKEAYADLVRTNGEIYDITSLATADFTNISAEAILNDSRIIRILRYAIAPSISQMKFGQIIGLGSTARFERQRASPGTSAYRDLEEVSERLSSFVRDNLDQDRFAWLGRRMSKADSDACRKYAKKWTCSILSHENTQTQFRNWRKRKQEEAIADAMVSRGYSRSDVSGVIQSKEAITPGEFTQETKVLGRTRQKADLAARSRLDGKLILIEAKSVGVEIDSTKRIKECCDKASDWRSSAKLDGPKVLAVIAGFFTETGIRNLELSGITVVWEHRLEDLYDFI